MSASSGEVPLSWRRRALFLATPYVVFLGLLGTVEVVVRASHPPLSGLDVFVSASQHAQFVDARRVHIFEGDPLLFWRLQPGLRDVVWEHTPVTTNELGMRYRTLPVPKPAGTFRVLCVGDSVTFGFGVPEAFVHRPQEPHPDWLPYPARLEKTLRAANPVRAIEVVPMAVPGYSTHQGLAWMRRDLARLQPDLVTLLFGWNDIGLRAHADRVAMRTDDWSVAARRLLCLSQALLYAFRALHQGASGGPSTLEPRVDREGFVANHRAMVDCARQCGATVAVIGTVYRDRVEYPPEGDWIADRRAALRTEMERLGVPYLEVPELTEAYWPGNRPLFLEHIHPNHKGHRLLAERLLAFLEDRKLLRDLIARRVDP